MLNLFRKKLFNLVVVVCVVLLFQGNILYAKATESDVEVSGAASPSDIIEDLATQEDIVDEDLFEENEVILEEPEEDVKEASVSDAKKNDGSGMEEEVIEESEEDECASPSAASYNTFEEEASSSEIKNTKDKTINLFKTPTKLFGAAPSNDIYMYLDGTVVHYTKSTPSHVKYEGGTIGDHYSKNNVQSGLGILPSNVTGVVIDDDLYPTLGTARGLFSNFSQITGVTNLNKLHLENATSIEALFTGCTNLTSIDMSALNLSNIQYADYIFAKTGITSIQSNPWSNAKKLETVSGMFLNCNINSINLTPLYTASINNFSGIFYGCTNLVTADLSNFNTKNATDMTYMFQNCSKLQNIYVGSDFVIPGGASTTSMFDGCTSLPGYDGTKVDGTMLSAYTKQKPKPKQNNNYSDSSSGSSGGGSGVTSDSSHLGPNKQTNHNAKMMVSNLNELTTSIYYEPRYRVKYILKNIYTEPEIAANGFYKVGNDTYFVDSYGVMTHGWVKDIDNNYYLFEWNQDSNYGKMIKGWKTVNNKWYYFNTDGKMLNNTITPDGYYVGADGSWINILY